MLFGENGVSAEFDFISIYYCFNDNNWNANKDFYVSKKGNKLFFYFFIFIFYIGWQ